MTSISPVKGRENFTTDPISASPTLMDPPSRAKSKLTNEKLQKTQTDQKPELPQFFERKKNQVNAPKVHSHLDQVINAEST